MNLIEGKTSNIEEKTSTINEAYDAAESLPTTLKSLRETHDEIVSLKASSEKNESDIQQKLTDTTAALSEVNALKVKIEAIKLTIDKMRDEIESQVSECLIELKQEAEGYIEKCEEAFRTSTSKGLAGAFEDKANKLNRSIQFWVAGLIGALMAGAWVGYNRLHALEAYLSDPSSTALKLVVQFILSIFSVGAPLWFAWLATKQIGQRFRLAEDYEFKASVSKAYEGYRREALQLDEDFSQRLFGNALTRLEEPPLRFVEEITPSSPLMEMLSSEQLKQLMEQGGEKCDSLLKKLGWQKKSRENNTNKKTFEKDDQFEEGEQEEEN